MQPTARRATARVLCELGMAAHRHMAHGWRLSIGYQLAWISGVALAPDQISNAEIVLNRLQLIALEHDSVFFHGVRLWVEKRF